jgi:hypothetical protein
MRTCTTISIVSRLGLFGAVFCCCFLITNLSSPDLALLWMAELQCHSAQPDKRGMLAGSSCSVPRSNSLHLTQRAANLSTALQDLAANASFTNFNVHYVPNPLEAGMSVGFVV